MSRTSALPDTDYSTWLAEADDRIELIVAMTQRSEGGSVVTDAELLPLHSSTFASRRMRIMGQFVLDENAPGPEPVNNFVVEKNTDNEVLASDMEQYFPFMMTATGVRFLKL